MAGTAPLLDVTTVMLSNKMTELGNIEGWTIVPTMLNTRRKQLTAFYMIYFRSDHGIESVTAAMRGKGANDGMINEFFQSKDTIAEMLAEMTEQPKVDVQEDIFIRIMNLARQKVYDSKALAANDAGIVNQIVYHSARLLPEVEEGVRTLRDEDFFYEVKDYVQREDFSVNDDQEVYNSTEQMTSRRIQDEIIALGDVLDWNEKGGIHLALSNALEDGIVIQTSFGFPFIDFVMPEWLANKIVARYGNYHMRSIRGFDRPYKRLGFEFNTLTFNQVVENTRDAGNAEEPAPERRPEDDEDDIYDNGDDETNRRDRGRRNQDDDDEEPAERHDEDAEQGREAHDERDADAEAATGTDQPPQEEGRQPEEEVNGQGEQDPQDDEIDEDTSEFLKERAEDEIQDMISLQTIPDKWNYVKRFSIAERQLGEIHVTDMFDDDVIISLTDSRRSPKYVLTIRLSDNAPRFVRIIDPRTD